jgi:hypothetical protein
VEFEQPKQLQLKQRYRSQTGITDYNVEIDNSEHKSVTLCREHGVKVETMFHHLSGIVV